MVRNSRFTLSDDLLEKLFDLLFEVIGNKSSKDEFRKIFVDLLTPAERIMLAKRVAIIYLLIKKIEYYNICDRLKVSPSTVAKYALLMEKSEGIVPTFKQIVKIDKVKIFLEEIFNNIFAPGKVGINWEIAWKNKFSLEKKKTFGI
ncbi:MAG: Trp family transcriptional regulator [Candidatus Roizmanbacteria bacterium]|nr:Trp family transcriptional regulator [Candidatus Roizmanbacteria bacterium]MCR4313223.1 Trp family transcriptional regulator [Candidatus Roizmanbacteria bacterium]